MELFVFGGCAWGLFFNDFSAIILTSYHIDASPLIFQVRFEKTKSRFTRILFLTEGMMKNFDACLAIHDNCHLLSHLLMYFGSLYCKYYEPRSDCSLEQSDQGS